MPNQQYWLRVRGRTAAALGELSDILQFEIRAVLQSSTPPPTPASHGTTYGERQPPARRGALCRPGGRVDCGWWAVLWIQLQ